jgi:hypothetical protein
MQKSSPLWLWLIPVLLLMFWLGARGLDIDSIWSDELHAISTIIRWPHHATETAVPMTFGDIINGLAERNPYMPPAYFFAARAWAQFTSFEPPALRALSLLYGMLTVVWTYLLGRQLFSRRVALYGAVALASSAFFIFYLHELRPYLQLAFCSVFTCWAYFRLVRTRRRASPLMWAALFAGTLALLYTQYFGALELAGLGAYHLLFVPKTRRWWQVSAVMFAAGLLFLPWIPVMLAGTAEQVERGSEGLSPLALLSELVYYASNGSLALLALIGVGTLTSRDRGARGLWFIILATLGVIIVLNARYQMVAAGRLRYLIGLWPLLSILIGLGTARIEQWVRRQATVPASLAPYVGATLLGAWMLLGVYNTVNPSYTSALDGVRDNFDFQRVTRPLLAAALPGDSLITYVPEDQSTRTNQRVGEYYYGPLDDRVDNVFAETAIDYPQENAYRAALDEVGEGRLRVWLASMTDHPSSSLSGFETFLQEQGYGICEQQVKPPDVRMSLYARSPVCCFADHAPEAVARYSDGIALVGLNPLPAAADDSLTVEMAWELAQAVPPDTYSISLQVIDANWNKVAQADDGLAAFAYTCQAITLPLADAPEGDYRLMATVYNWKTGEQLAGTLDATGEQGNLLPIANITIAHG